MPCEAAGSESVGTKRTFSPHLKHVVSWSKTLAVALPMAKVMIVAVTVAVAVALAMAMAMSMAMAMAVAVAMFFVEDVCHEKHVEQQSSFLTNGYAV